MDESPVDVMPHAVLGNVLVLESEECSELEVASDKSDSVSVQSEFKALPPEWPKLPEISLPLSLDFTTATHPSINKAISHLEVLQGTMNCWSSEKRLVSGHQNEVICSARKRKRIKFPVVPENQSDGETLSVRGQGGDVFPGSAQEIEAAQIEAEDVVREVITLLAKLENDRRESKKCLELERKKVQMLSSTVDAMLEQRLHTLPEEVQREHEACALDIGELAWNVSYRGRIEANLASTVETEERLNSRLKTAVAHVIEQTPLVEEKLALEDEAMDRISRAQIETSTELERTNATCEKVTSKSVQAHGKAQKERRFVESDLNNARQSLQTVSDNLLDAQKKYDSFVQCCSDSRKQIEMNKQNILVFQVKNENARSSEALQSAKVHDLTLKILNEQERCTKVQEAITQCASELKDQRTTISQGEQAMKIRLMRKEDEFREAARKTQEVQLNIDDMTQKIDDCDKCRKTDEKNMSRMSKDISRTRESMKLTQGQLTSVQDTNKIVTGKFRRTQNQALIKEANLKAKEATLQAQIRDEIQSRILLRSHLDTDAANLARDKMETKRQITRISQKLADAEAVVKSLSRKVSELQSVRELRAKQAAELKLDVDHLEKERIELVNSTEQEIDSLRPEEKRRQDHLLAVEKRLSDMDWNENMMKENMRDMDKASVVMERTLGKTLTSIETNCFELDQLTVQIAAENHKLGLLDAQFKETCDRLESSRRLHASMIEDRQVVREEYRDNLEHYVRLNKELAAKYRQLQGNYLALKGEMLDRLGDRVKAEMFVKDLKKVQGLQQRMKAAVSSYNQLRSLYNRNELSQMELESNERDKQVGHLKSKIESTLNSMIEHLHLLFESNQRPDQRSTTRHSEHEHEIRTEISSL